LSANVVALAQSMRLVRGKPMLTVTAIRAYRRALGKLPARARRAQAEELLVLAMRCARMGKRGAAAMAQLARLSVSLLGQR
jgi:hypothetical protein